MIKKGIGVTIIFIISTFIQLVSQIVVTRLFGARIDLDIFLAAVAMPTIFVTIIYGTLNDAFLPLYGERRAQNNADADSYFFSTLLLLTGISFVIALLMNLFSPVISAALYQSRGEQFVKDVSIQMSYMFYSIPLSVIATLFGTYLYVQKKFIRFPLAQLIGSLANLAIIILLAPTFRIWALVVAFVINILIQIIFVIPKLTFSFNFKNIKFYTLLIAWIPLIIGSFALRTDTLLIRSFGASLPQGYLVYLNLISKIFSLATSVMTIGIQIILLPHIVEYLSNKNYTKAIENVNKAKITAVGISVVVTILLALIAPIAIKLLFVGNKFTPKDAEVTISLLPLFILPAIGWGVNSVFFQPLIALKKQIPLGIINVIALIIGWSGGLIIKNVFGTLPGIAGGLILLLFSGILGSELLWQFYKKKLVESPLLS
jgi:peptidoglycan biosynthesis protein MviN/MurJ (putative lipid II flippase)